jgi:hypothetical protein
MERQAATYCNLVPLHEADEQFGVAEAAGPALGNRQDAWQESDSGVPLRKRVTVVAVEALNHRRVRPCRAWQGDSAPVKHDSGAFGVGFLIGDLLPDDQSLRRDRPARGDGEEVEQAPLPLGNHLSGKIGLGHAGEEIEDRALRRRKGFAHRATLTATV